MGNGASKREWRHVLEVRGGFERFWKSQLVELSPASEEDGWLPLARGGLGQVLHEMGGGRWKSQNIKIVPLSPYVEKPLNSKVIKSFVPELRNRKCFSCFEIPMFYVIYYEHYEHPMYISHSRIWLWYNKVNFSLLSHVSPFFRFPQITQNTVPFLSIWWNKFDIFC